MVNVFPFPVFIHLCEEMQRSVESRFYDLPDRILSPVSRFYLFIKGA